MTESAQGGKVLTLSEAAECYAEMGFSVFPCVPGDKRPLVATGFHAATTDVEQVRAWWSATPQANIGVHTAGLLVVDIDDMQSEWFGEYQDDLQDCSALAVTPRGGRHYWFAAPEGVELTCGTGCPAAGIDYRSNGGYVIVPPSRTAAGMYQWATGAEPIEGPESFETAPGWLVDQIIGFRRQERQAVTGERGVIPNGRRNSTLAKYAGHMRQVGIEESAILAAMLEMNSARCFPPLEREEVEQIVRSIGRYEPNGDFADAMDFDPAILGMRVDTTSRKQLKSRGDGGVGAVDTSPFTPFPTDVFPGPVRELVEAGAAAQGVDPAFFAVPVLSVLASCIGSSRTLRVKGGWYVPPILWTAVVAESGGGKSPALSTVTEGLKAIQGKRLDEHAEEMREYQSAMVQFERDRKVWSRIKGDAGAPPEPPAVPQAVRHMVSDTTVQALAPILLANPRGVLMLRDELAGWLGSFNQFNSGQSDEPSWLSMFNGDQVLVDRKTGIPPVIRVPRAYVSVCGSIQPGRFRELMGKAQRDSGLMPRFLYTQPPRSPRRWTDETLDSHVKENFQDVIERLLMLQPDVSLEHGERPRVVDMSPDAKSQFVGFFNTHGQEQLELSGDMAAIWSKLEESAARIALVLQMAKSVCGEGFAESVDAHTMNSAICVVKWFKNEASRIMFTLAAGEEDIERQRLVEYIRERGGRITARDLQRNKRSVRTAEEADELLNDLVDAGLAEWEPIPPGEKGGKAYRVLKLSTAPTPTEPMNSS